MHGLLEGLAVVINSLGDGNSLLRQNVAATSSIFQDHDILRGVENQPTIVACDHPVQVLGNGFKFDADQALESSIEQFPILDAAISQLNPD